MDGAHHGSTPAGYPAAVALLRAVYDMIDAVKTWEAETGLDGAALFAQTCKVLDSARAGTSSRVIDRGATPSQPRPERDLVVELGEIRDDRRFKPLG